MPLMTIGKVAEYAGLGVETVRSYERQGLIEKPQRKSSGYRQFSPKVIPRLHFIKRARDLGFSLDEIRELLTLQVDSDACCDSVYQRAVVQIEEVDSKIAGLAKIRSALVELAERCRDEHPEDSCPFLDALDAQSQG